MGVRLGFALPQFGGQAREIGRVAEFARHAEQAGAHSLWVGDRLLAPVDPSVGYGGGSTIPAEFGAVLDPFALLTIAAGATESALLGTNVLNLPWYPPALLARSLTAIDLLSGGRLRPGFGLGWSPEEYQAANIPFERRGARLEEGLDALEALWTTNPAEYHGRLWTVPTTRVDLRPARRPPIYLGAVAEAALRRTGRRADGWLPVIVLPGATDPARLLAGRRIVHQAALDAGRRPEDIDIILRVNVAADVPVDAIAEAIRAVAGETGITHAFVDLMYAAPTVTAALHLVDQLLTSLAD